MSKKKSEQEANSDKYFILSENLNRLQEELQLFVTQPQSNELKQSISDILMQMHNDAKIIGGVVFDHTSDLEIDIQLFLQNPKKDDLTPKISEDFLSLQNDLRSL